MGEEKERLTSNIKDLLNLESNTFVENQEENVIFEREIVQFTKLLSASLELIADYFKEVLIEVRLAMLNYKP